MTSARAAGAAALLALALANRAAADVDITASQGHDGRVIANCVTPAFVDLRNTGAETVEVRLQLRRGSAFSSGGVEHERVVVLTPHARRREPFLLPAQDGWGEPVRVTVTTRPQVPVHDGARTNSRGRIDVEAPATNLVSSSGRVVGVLGDAASALASGLPRAAPSGVLNVVGELGTVDVVRITEEELALGPLAIEGLDALVVSDPEADFCRDAQALDGLLDWVALGHLLVVAPGTRAAQLGATALGPYLPARGTPRQEAYEAVVRGLVVASAEDLPDDARDPGDATGLWLPLTGACRGTGPGDEPLYVDRRLGDGTVRLLAFDVRRALAASTEDQHVAALATVLCGRPCAVRDLTLGDTLAEWRYGATRDVDQEAQELLRRDALEAPPRVAVFFALLLYVLVVGPLDWFVLRRLGRPRLTTITFAGTVVAFTALAYGVSFLMFSTGDRLNRLVIVDLADGGRDGRQLAQVHDFAGCYSSHGADRRLQFDLPVAIAGASLPGGGTGDSGTSFPLVASGTDPLAPDVEVAIAFRSLRAVRSIQAGTTGRTIETEWVREAGRSPRLRITNGLPVTLDDVIVLMPAGESQSLVSVGLTPGTSEFAVPASSAGATSGGVLGTRERDLLAFLSRASAVGFDGVPASRTRPQRLSLERQAVLERCGIAHGRTFAQRRALLLAFASESPVRLPGDDVEGHRWIVIRKEVELP
mgnify:CR=1 FL=1